MPQTFLCITQIRLAQLFICTVNESRTRCAKCLLQLIYNFKQNKFPKLFTNLRAHRPTLRLLYFDRFSLYRFSRKTVTFFASL